MWHNRTTLPRRILCKECEQETDAPVHKCDACQVLLLDPRITLEGLGIRVRYPRGTRGIDPGRIPRFPTGILGYPEVLWQLLRDTPEIPKGYQVAKAKNEFWASMWDNKAKTGRRTLCKACCQQQNDASGQPVHKCDACQVLLLGTPDYLGGPRDTRKVSSWYP